MKKRGSSLQEVVVHIILVALIFAMFFLATAEKVNARGVKQQALEKQTAILIESAVPGMSFEIKIDNPRGYVNNVKIDAGRIYVSVNGLASVKGYPYFSPYSVGVEKLEDKFVVSINE